MFKLVISDDEGKTTVVPLVREEVSIGRKEGNTIRLTERNISRKHAKLLKANGAFVVEDLNSYNGVKVNGRKIDGRVNLKAGDQLGIGDYQLALQSDAIAEVPTAEVPTDAAAPDPATAMIAAPDEPRPPARLVMLTPPAPGAEFALSRERQRIGRAEDLPIWVNHRSISREHAEIVREGDSFRLIDLGSANGLRLNGGDIEEAPLSPGDVVELGQVSFRYVGEGETYVFDHDATVQMESLNLPEPVSKTPIFAAAGIILLAVVVAGVVALSGGDDDPTTQITTISGGGIEPVAGFDVERSVAECRSAIERRDAEGALAHAGAAVEASPSDPAAIGCQQDAQRLSDEAAIFEMGRTALNENNIDEATMQFGGLASNSPFRGEPEVAQANDAFAQQKLPEARAALAAGNAAGATNLASLVDNTEGMAAEHRRTAQRIMARAAAAGAAPAVVVVNNNVPDRPRDRDRDRPRGMMTPVMTMAPAMVVTMAPAATMGNALIECAAENNYNACILRNLRNPSSPREFAAVIEAERGRSQRQRACGLMRQLVARHPSSREARLYGQYLERQCN
ncbi:MAG: FHA domain-containing protein [Deltaproteobacteria bacterium]|nr:FHA domain-containing protein [Deltaproteobacteria bacterium]